VRCRRLKKDGWPRVRLSKDDLLRSKAALEDACVAAYTPFTGPGSFVAISVSGGAIPFMLEDE
jgi:hypothetical protein